MATRRTLLGTALAAVGASAARGTPAEAQTGPDAAVIRLCDEFIELQAAECAIYEGPNSIKDDKEATLAAAPVRARTDEIIGKLGGFRAATPAGVLARARAVAAANGDFGSSFDFPRDDGIGQMLAYLLRDAAAIGAPLPRVVVDPSEPQEEC